MLDESICHFRSVRSILSLSFYLVWKTLLANSVDPEQMPHYGSAMFAYDLFMDFQVRMG